jgi:glycosyltransferase involved in cell wall biosynthesis
MKKVLFFFPHNPMNKNAGCKIRALKLLEYFKNRCTVDLIGLKDWDNWSNGSSLQQNGLVNEIHLVSRKPVKKNPIAYFFKYKLPNSSFQRKIQVKGSIPNYATFHMQSSFNEILRKGQYDFVIISYAYWADLVKGNPFLKGAKTIIDTHDLLSAQHRNDTGIALGKALQDELDRLALFDQIWAISIEEQYFFSQFLNRRVELVPMVFKRPLLKNAVEKNFDLIYVASENENNIKSITWFFNEVYPKLTDKIRICIVGKIAEFVNDCPGLVKIPFTPDLDQYYAQSKIAICPMLGGTGLKIKVVEALSYGLPVVCTSRGVDGMINKLNSGCLVEDEATGFSEQIRLLLADQAFYNKQSSQAAEFFEGAFDQVTGFRKLDQLFNFTNT